MLAADFTPVPLTVPAGSTVQFQNNSGVSHTVTFDAPRSPGVEDVPLHSSGTNSRVFSQAGTFPFHCTQHGAMTGRIVVN
jgi:plastocyanin